MREHLGRSLRRLAAMAVILLCLTPAALVPRQSAHAAGTITIGIINARYGQLHLTGTGLLPNRLLYVMITAATLANPNYIVRTFTLVTTPTGSFDEDYWLGLFVCGTTVHAEVLDGTQYVLAESVPFTAQCPVTNPRLTVTSVANGLIGVSGQDFEIQESVAITATSTLTSRINVGSAMTDLTGAFSTTVPLAPFGCGETIVVTALGAAGSATQSAPFFYSCLPVQAGEPVHAPPPRAGAQPAGAGASGSHAAIVHGVRLEVASGPPSVSYQQSEAMRIATGVPDAVLTIRLSAVGVVLSTVTIHADAHGNAAFSYRVPMHLKVGTRLTVSFTVSYSRGTVHFLHTGSFTVVGA